MKFEIIDRIELRMLLCFERVATLGSFSAASRQLGIPRAAVSRLVQKLEDQVGAQLFQRTTRTVSLTEEGHALVDAALPALSSLRGALLDATTTTQDLRGTVRFSVSQAFGRRFVLPALPEFSKAYPHVRLEMSVADELDDLVAESLDFTVRLGALPDSSMITRRLAELDVVLAIPAPLLKGRKPPSSPSELDGFPMIGFRVPGTQSLYRWHFEKDGQTQTRVPDSAHLITDSIEDVAQLVCAGAGIAPLPTYIAADHVEDGTLIPALRDYRLPSVPLQFCFPGRGKRPARVNVLANHLVAHIKAALS